MTGSGDVRRAEERAREILLLTITILVLLTIAIASLLYSLLVHVQADDRSADAVRDLAGQVWPFCLTTALGLFVYERSLRKKFVLDLIDISGPRVVEALRPSSVMETLLRRIYGPLAENSDVALCVLGGEGERDDELSVSTSTEVTYTLTATTPDQYELGSTIAYAYKGSVQSSKFLIVATCDPKIRDLVVLGCEEPLFDSWYVSDAALFDKSVKRIQESATISIRYLNDKGRKCETEFRPAHLKPKGHLKWAEYLSFFRRPVGGSVKLDAKHYKDQLRLFECDLSTHARADGQTVDRILGLRLSVSSLQPVSDGYCFWSAPYPCLVTSFSFDAKRFDLGGDRVFRPVVFGVRPPTLPKDAWLKSDELTTVNVNSWMLPGHGFALMWRDNLSQEGGRAGVEGGGVEDCHGASDEQHRSESTSPSGRSGPVAKPAPT